MGLTLHYQFRCDTRSVNRALERVTRLRQRALDLPFERVADLVELAGSECDYQEYGQDHPLRWLLIQARQQVDYPPFSGASYLVAPTHVVAFSTVPGEGCEEANFGLCRFPAAIEIEDPQRRGTRRTIPTKLDHWRWGSFCKTQYASLPEYGGVTNFFCCHLSVIRLLDQASELGILADVNDEGGYWERRDLAALAQAVGEQHVQIARLARHLQKRWGANLVAAIMDFSKFEPRATPG